MKTGALIVAALCAAGSLSVGVGAQQAPKRSAAERFQKDSAYLKSTAGSYALDRTKAAEVPIPVQSVSGVRVTADVDAVEFSFRTGLATIPVIAVGRRAPRADGSFNPRDQVGASFPIFAGERSDHRIRIPNLAARTEYFYVITAVIPRSVARSAEGKPAVFRGTFRTSGTFDNGPVLIPADD